MTIVHLNESEINKDMFLNGMDTIRTDKGKLFSPLLDHQFQTIGYNVIQILCMAWPIIYNILY